MDGAVSPQDGIERRGWLARQDEEFRDAILSRGLRRRLRSGEPLLFAGDEAGGLFGVASGSLGLVIGTTRQQPMLSHIHQPGAWLGEGPAITGEPRFMSVTALEPAHLIQVPRSLISRLETEGFGIQSRVAELMWWNQKLAAQLAYDLLIPMAPRRLAAVLYRVTGYGELEPSHPAGFTMTQSQLAQMANCSRSIVSRTLRVLQARGWVSVSYSRTRILNGDALADFAYAEDGFATDGDGR